MVTAEVLRVAFEAVRANKLRSFLTTLGIVIGIAAVITMGALGEGARRAVEEQVRRLGTNVLTVRPGQQFQGGVDRGDARLTTEDAEALRAAGGAVRNVAPEIERRVQVQHAAANASLEVLGTWPSYFDVRSHAVAAGRLFSEAEERGRRRVAVLGARIGESLGGAPTAALLGATITVAGVPFEVVGVLAEKGQQGWMDPDATIYVPLSTAHHRVFGTDALRAINVQATDETAMDAALAQVDAVLRREHRIRPGEPSDFQVRDPAGLLGTFGETTRTFSLLLAGISLVSLLVGGIGIMNIMLVSVTERTREIGVRKALGARRRDILLQFLIEALAICLAGGVIGVGLGLAAGAALRRFAGWQAFVAPEAILAAFAFAAAVGLFFGIWPARRAARLDPIAALRYE
ncbi:MAG TPA: ABC transporter permease [Gemmatimonadota bacterium]